jgi:hypothetical protein
MSGSVPDRSCCDYVRLPSLYYPAQGFWERRSKTVAYGHDTNKDIGILYFACYRISNMGRITSPVDFNLLSGFTVNMHGCPVFFLILLSVIIKLGIHQRTVPCHLALIDVFRPKKLFCYTIAHQFFSDALVIWQTFVAVRNLRIQDFFRSAFVVLTFNGQLI